MYFSKQFHKNTGTGNSRAYNLKAAPSDPVPSIIPVTVDMDF